MEIFIDSMTLEEARDLLRERIDEGETCPCCKQFAKIYKRTINSTMARALILIYRSYEQEFGSIPELRAALAPHHSNEEPKLRYWGLLEEEGVRRPDGGRAGYWRVTDDGVAWIYHYRTVPKYAHIYDGRRLRSSGPEVTIRDALGTKFNYDELMAW